MRRLFLAFGVAALALSGLAFTTPGDTPAPLPELEVAPTHTLSIKYQQQRGAFRRAMLTLAPNERGAAPLWQGDLASIVVVTKDGP